MHAGIVGIVVLLWLCLLLPDLYSPTYTHTRLYSLTQLSRCLSSSSYTYQVNYDQNKELSILKSDIILLQQDFEQRQTECSNLKLALENVQKNYDKEYKRLNDHFLVQLDQKKTDMELKMDEMKDEFEFKCNQMKDEKLKIENKLGDEALLRRKAEIDMNTGR